jgi:hypothetical protein
MNQPVNPRKEAVPVVSDGRRYGYADTVHVDHLYVDHYGTLMLFHPADQPWELRDGATSAVQLAMSNKQARSLRDQLNAMDLGDNDTKGQ